MGGERIERWILGCMRNCLRIIWREIGLRNRRRHSKELRREYVERGVRSRQRYRKGLRRSWWTKKAPNFWLGIKEKERWRHRSGLRWALRGRSPRSRNKLGFRLLWSALDNCGKTCYQIMQLCISRKGDVGFERIFERLKSTDVFYRRIGDGERCVEIVDFAY